MTCPQKVRLLVEVGGNLRWRAPRLPNRCMREIRVRGSWRSVRFVIFSRGMRLLFRIMWGRVILGDWGWWWWVMVDDGWGGMGRIFLSCCFDWLIDDFSLVLVFGFLIPLWRMECGMVDFSYLELFCMWTSFHFRVIDSKVFDQDISTFRRGIAKCTSFQFRVNGSKVLDQDRFNFQEKNRKVHADQISSSILYHSFSLPAFSFPSFPFYRTFCLLQYLRMLSSIFLLNNPSLREKILSTTSRSNIIPPFDAYSTPDQAQERWSIW